MSLSILNKSPFSSPTATDDLTGQCCATTPNVRRKRFRSSPIYSGGTHRACRSAHIPTTPKPLREKLNHRIRITGKRSSLRPSASGIACTTNNCSVPMADILKFPLLERNALHVLREVNDLKDKVTNLEATLSKLTPLIPLLDSNSRTETATLIKAASLINTLSSEITHRIKCNRQIIVFNIPETMPAMRAKDAILDICGLSQRPCRVTRLRKTQHSTNRALLLEFQEEIDTRPFLENLDILKCHPSFSRIVIRASLTPLQREIAKITRPEITHKATKLEALQPESGHSPAVDIDILTPPKVHSENNPKTTPITTSNITECATNRTMLDTDQIESSIPHNQISLPPIAIARTPMPEFEDERPPQLLEHTQTIDSHNRTNSKHDTQAVGIQQICSPLDDTTAIATPTPIASIPPGRNFTRPPRNNDTTATTSGLPNRKSTKASNVTKTTTYYPPANRPRKNNRARNPRPLQSKTNKMTNIHTPAASTIYTNNKGPKILDYPTKQNSTPPWPITTDTPSASISSGPYIKPPPLMSLRFTTPPVTQMPCPNLALFPPVYIPPPLPVIPPPLLPVWPHMHAHHHRYHPKHNRWQPHTFPKISK